MHISNYTTEFSNRIEGKWDKLTVSVTDSVALTCQSLYVDVIHIVISVILAGALFQSDTHVRRGV